MSDYLFDQAWTNEKRRLDALGAMYDQGTIARLERVGVGPGWRCLEVGAGSGTVARWMASRVGPGGGVLATDIDPRFLDLLSDDGVEVRRHDIAADPLEPRAFDVIHTRAVLQHVPARERALANMIQALRPGGWLVLEDIVMPHPACHPSLPLWGKILGAMEAGLRGRGADPYFGLKLRDLMVEGGLVDVDCDSRVPMMFSGTPSMDFVTLSVEQVGDRLIEAGIISTSELSDVLGAFRAPGHTMTAAIMITAWGAAPSSSGRE
jgi:SAM-dependent methyltransferase